MNPDLDRVLGVPAVLELGEPEALLGCRGAVHTGGQEDKVQGVQGYMGTKYKVQEYRGTRLPSLSDNVGKGNQAPPFRGVS